MNKSVLAAPHHLPGFSQQRDKTQRELLGFVEKEAKSRLKHSLHNRIFITLDKTEDSNQVNPPWTIDLKIGTGESEGLPSQMTITESYDRQDINSRLLILGAPGSGKTTTLLQLAQDLISRAQDNTNQPIPVLLNLSSWKEDKQSIKDWIIDDLKQKYGVRKDIGQEWLEKAVIIPLLDGLDEVASARQGLCVEKINEFLAPSIWSSSLVVCSRSEEYQLLSHQDQSHSQAKKLELNGAVVLQPLTQKQIQDYLQRATEEELWKSINNDESLIELAKNPLFLNIIVISRQEISLFEWQKLSDSKQRLSYLFNAYIKRMLGRPYKKKRFQPKHKKTIAWLGWLAEQLIKQNQTEFLMEKIEPYWLNNNKEKLIVGLIYGLILGLILGLIFGLSEGLSEGLIFGLSEGLTLGLTFGLILGLLFGMTRVKINSWITIAYSSSKLIYGLIFGLSIGLINNLSEGLIYGLINGLIYGLICVLIYGLISGLVHGLKGKKEIDIKKHPEQAIKENLKNAVYISSGLVVIFIVFFFLIFQILLKYMSDLDWNEVGSVLIRLGGVAMAFTLWFTTKPVIEHFSLRVVLCLNGYLPWNYARFLDYATDRLFLQRVGGGYRFVHRFLQEHLAQMWREKQRV